MFAYWLNWKTKKETQVNKTWWYRENFWYKNEETYLEYGYLPHGDYYVRMIVDPYENLETWLCGDEKNYISFDKTNVYKNFKIIN